MKEEESTLNVDTARLTADDQRKSTSVLLTHFESVNIVSCIVKQKVHLKQATQINDLQHTVYAQYLLRYCGDSDQLCDGCTE